MDLTDFITARLAEDEATALAAQRTAMPDGELANQAGPCVTDEGYAHVARHDPARVMREVAAKRAMVALHQHYPAFTKDPGGPDFGCGLCHSNGDYGIEGHGWCDTLRELAAIWAGHGDYPGVAGDKATMDNVG